MYCLPVSMWLGCICVFLNSSGRRGKDQYKIRYYQNTLNQMLVGTGSNVLLCIYCACFHDQNKWLIFNMWNMCESVFNSRVHLFFNNMTVLPGSTSPSSWVVKTVHCCLPSLFGEVCVAIRDGYFCIVWLSLAQLMETGQQWKSLIMM